jgi:hypothetical protein
VKGMTEEHCDEIHPERRLDARRRWFVDEYRVADVVTRIRADHPALASGIRRFLSCFHQAPSGEKPQIEFSLVVDDDPTTANPTPVDADVLCDVEVMCFRRRGDTRYVEVSKAMTGMADVSTNRAVGFVSPDAVADEWTVPHLLFYPLWAQMLKGEGLFAIHAAAAVKDGRGLLFPASSGSGKSVLSLRLAGSGYGLLGDDTVFLKRRGRAVEIVGFPEHISLRPDALRMFPDAGSPREALMFGGKISVDAAQLYPGCIAERAVVTAVLFPEIAGVPQTTLTPMGAAEALVRLLPYNVLLLDPSSYREHLALLADLVRAATCMTMRTGSDRDPMLAAIEESISGCVAAPGPVAERSLV